MTRALVFGLFVIIAMSSSAQTFQGHRIGESISDFLDAEPTIQNGVVYCQTTTPHQLSPQEVAMLSPVSLLNRYGPRAKTFKNFIYIEAHYTKAFNGRRSQQDQEQAEYRSKCVDMRNLISKGNGEITGVGVGPNTYSREVNEYSRQFVFEVGHLVEFSSDMSAGFGQARDDISAKLGEEPTETSTSYENNVGGNWNDHAASWESETLHVELFLSDNPSRETGKPKFLVESLQKKLHDIQSNQLRSLRRVE